MLSKYARGELIGSGTFGKVWLVRLKANRKTYVLKEVQLAKMNPKEKQQALVEVSVLAQCKHPHIIRYKEGMINVENNTLCMIMEYANGGDLYSVIRKREGIYFLESDILIWFVQICLALQYIHNKNILHRDLKTQNIFLTQEKTIKVGDFGISRMLQCESDLATTAIGTPYYLSPEICLRKPYNFKSDIWALGCVLFEMAALYHPFQAVSFHQLVSKILNTECRELPSQCSLFVKDLIKVMMHQNPDKRPSTHQILAVPALQPYLQKLLTAYSALQITNSPHPSPKSQVSKIDDENDTSRKRRASSSAIGGQNKIQKSYFEKIKTERQRYLSSPRLQDTKTNSRTFFTPENKDRKVQVNKKTNTEHKAYISSEYTQRTPTAASKTYTLIKKNSEKHAIFAALELKSPSSLNKRLLNLETDGGYQSGTTKLESPTLHVATPPVKGFPKPSTTYTKDDITDANCKDDGFTDVVFNNSSPADSNVFITKNRRGADLADFQCPHSCQECLLDSLWHNRIRSPGVDTDDVKKLHLRQKLAATFGENNFKSIYKKLAAAWNGDSDETRQTLKTAIQHISCYQKQHVPLLLQLLQLDMVERK